MRLRVQGGGGECQASAVQVSKCAHSFSSSSSSRPLTLSRLLLLVPTHPLTLPSSFSRQVEGLDDSAPPIMSISKLSKLHIQARSIEQQQHLQHQRQRQPKQQQYPGLPSAATSPMAGTAPSFLSPTSPFASPPRGADGGAGVGKGRREPVTFSNLSLAPATLNPLAAPTNPKVQALEKAYAPERPKPCVAAMGLPMGTCGSPSGVAEALE
jgi:hypothetical protein